MNASKLARWAALPAAAIVATSAGVAFAEDEAATTPAAPAAEAEDPEATETDTADAAGDDAVAGPERSPDELATDLRAFLETEEGRALLTELVAAADLDDAQVEELKAAIAELQVAVREAAADRTATSMQLDELRERIREMAMTLGHEAPHDTAEATEEASTDEDATDEDADAAGEGHRRGWQEKQAGQSRGWNADEQMTNESATAEHGEKRGWEAKQDGESRGEDAAVERQGRADGTEHGDA